MTSPRPTSPQTIRVRRDGVEFEATIAWRLEQQDWQWLVSLDLPTAGPVEARANDAFEALCRVRDLVEADGWRIGVAGAQVDVWPSGMARDQGGGLRAYRVTDEGAQGLVDTFEPVDPATVTTAAEQRAAADRWYERMRRRADTR